MTIGQFIQELEYRLRRAPNWRYYSLVTTAVILGFLVPGLAGVGVGFTILVVAWVDAWLWRPDETLKNDDKDNL